MYNVHYTINKQLTTQLQNFKLKTSTTSTILLKTISPKHHLLINKTTTSH